MFNVSKKTLSLVLCLTLIASVVVFCFAGSASAVTTVKYPTYDSVKSLAAESKSSLVVDLDFEGANRYGLPLNRGNHVFYDTPGFATVQNSGGWAFIGKTGEALKNASGADLGGTVYRTHADAAYIVENYLYQFKAGTKYQLVMDYKFLAGSKITNTRTVGLAMYQNPHQPASGVETPLKEVKISSVISGNKAVWNVDGVAQTGEVLEKDTDIQTMTATFLPEADGYLAVRTHDGDTTDGTLAIDSIKIYSDSGLGDTYQNPIAFDDGGVVINRYVNSVGYATEENGNGYCVIDGTGGSSTGSFYFANAEYGKTILNKDQAAADSSINDKMFKFLPGHSYEVTFRFRIAENANNNVTLGSTKLQPRLAKAPAGDAHNNDDLYGVNPWAKDIIYSGITVQQIGVWQTAKITFTVKTPEESEAGFTGAYFGFRGGGLVTHIDDYNVRELINYSVKTFDATNVSIDFDNTMPTDVTRKNATVTYGTDEKTGSKYMKVTAEGNARISMAETRVLKMNKKYYISFDAKSEDGCTNFNLIMGDKVSNYRIFLTDTDPKKALNSSGSKFYINGKEVSGYDSFVPSSEWRHYGFTLNLDYEKWNQIQSSGHIVNDTDNWQKLEAGGGVYLLFGAGINQSGTSICYDNIKISQFDEIPNAVPDEGEIKDNTQVSKRNPSGTGDSYVSAGLRFKNSLPNDVVAAADEVGFVVIPSSMAVSAPNSWYDLEGNGHTDAKKVVCKDNSTNRYYEKTGFDTYYQLVLTGLSTDTGKTAYNRRFSAVLYVKNGDTYTYHALGETSYNQVGAIKDVINAQ